MQIRAKLTLQFSAVVGSIVLFSFLLLYYYSARYNQEQFHKRLVDKAITSAVLLLHVEEVDSSLLKIINRAERDILYGENISIFDDTSTEIYTTNDTISFTIGPALMREIKVKETTFFSQGDFDIAGVLFHAKKREFVVVAGAIDIIGNNQLSNLQKILISLYAVTMAIVSVAGWVYAGRALAPINDLIVEVNSISIDDLSKRVHEPKHKDEIGKLATIFNELLSRIENAFVLQKAFVTNVSHELKNPLTKITSQLEVTLLNERTNEYYREVTQSVLEDIKELNQLSGSLLDLASLHEGRKVSMTRIRIDEILWEVIENVKELDNHYKIDIKAVHLPEEEEKLLVFGNSHLLKTAIQNIVENACKFSTDHRAEVSLFWSNDQIEIRVFDNGPGISKEDLENIFQPFFRANNTSKIKGHGIGLSLSQRIISMHNGVVEIDSTLSSGTFVNIILRPISRI